jgi:predicted phage baseplate assembly protein
MSEPAVRLDPRHYQDLVDEARRRVGEQCPEWTDHNVSDPGMTLIDQFAWMTDILLYRVNRLPDRVHEALLNLLGVRLLPAVPATAGLRFRLARPPARPIEISAGSGPRTGGGAVGGRKPAVEVASMPDEDRPGVVFQVREDAVIPVLSLAAVATWRADRLEGDQLTVGTVVDGVGRLGSDRTGHPVFSTRPRSDDALYLGFDEPIANLVLQLHVEATPAMGTAIDPDLAPLEWEVAQADGTWEPPEEDAPVGVLLDKTGGFNYPIGLVELQIPASSARTLLGGVSKHWLRCRPKKAFAHSRDGQHVFSRSPQIRTIRANAIGVLAKAHHAKLVEAEELGVSDGTAGQTFRVLHAPTLDLGDGETVEVEVRRLDRRDASSALGRSGRLQVRWEDWTQRQDLAASSRSDRHFLFDPSSGEVQFGVAIKQRGYADAVDGAATEQERRESQPGWHVHGAIPPAGARIRMSRYRYGGGAEGNLEADTLTVLRTPIPGVASVTNPRAATGGRDGETLAGAQHRAADDLRLRRRAVTREDFEVIAKNASTLVERARCIAPEVDPHRFPDPEHDERKSTRPRRSDRRDPWPRTAVTVCVLPRVDDPTGYIPRDQLRASQELRRAVIERLEECCLVGTSAHVTPVAFREVTVAVEVLISVSASPVIVEQDIIDALHGYLNPLIGGNLDGDGDGWQWGRALDISELRLLIARVAGVVTTTQLRVYETGLPPDDEDGRTYRLITGRLELGRHELVASGRHQARARHAEV